MDNSYHFSPFTASPEGEEDPPEEFPNYNQGKHTLGTGNAILGSANDMKNFGMNPTTSTSASLKSPNFPPT